MSKDLSKKTKAILKDLGHEISETSSSILVDTLSKELLCPMCQKNPVGDRPALSRSDNKTYICSPCGMEEAIGHIAKIAPALAKAEIKSSIQGKAELMLDQFELKVRSNGDEFYNSLKDTRKDWMQDVCREAHGEMMPDDYKYNFIREALFAS